MRRLRPMHGVAAVLAPRPGSFCHQLACHRLEMPGRPLTQGGMFVAGLVVAGFIGVVLVLYAADRIVKARAQVRRLRSMSDRLAAATARAEEQQERRQAAERASQELTSVLPAIQRPPLTVPGMRPHGAARPRTGCERPGQQDRRAAQPGRRPSHTGEHPARPAGRAPR
jgi:hypothetical protein